MHAAHRRRSSLAISPRAQPQSFVEMSYPPHRDPGEAEAQEALMNGTGPEEPKTIDEDDEEAMDGVR